MRSLLCLVVITACTRAHEAEALRDEAMTIADAQQPALDALAARLEALRHAMGGNRPGWETMLRIADLANDELGLPPFTQSVAPGPEWHPSPATLLGIGGYVRTKASELAKRGGLDELRSLVADERRRYASGIQQVGERLAQVEAWAATTDRP